MTVSYKTLDGAIGKKIKLCLIIGNDEYVISRCAEKVVAACPGAERIRFDALDLNPAKLEEAFFSFPLMSKRLLVIDNFKTGEMKSEVNALFEELLREIPDFLTVLLRNFTEGRFSVNKQCEKLLSDVTPSLTVLAEKMSGRDAREEIERIAGEEGASVSPEAANLLLFLLGDSLMPARSEIKKLAALSGYARIEEDHVRRMTAKTVESGVFDMIREIERKNSAKALSALREMLDSRHNALAITANLNTAYINLYRAKQAAKRGLKEKDMFSAFDYRKGDRKVAIAIGRERYYTEERLENILELLYELDADLKSSPADGGILLEIAVSELAER